MSELLLERVLEKLDDIREEVGKIEVTLAVNTSSLAEHMRRTEILEEQHKALSRKVTIAEGAIKLVGLMSAAAGALKFFGAF